MQVKERGPLEKYGISLHSGPVSDPGLGPGGREALQPCPAASPPLEMSPQPSPLFLFHPSYGLAGTTSPPGRRDARQVLGGGRVGLPVANGPKTTLRLTIPKRFGFGSPLGNGVNLLEMPRKWSRYPSRYQGLKTPPKP